MKGPWPSWAERERQATARASETAQDASDAAARYANPDAGGERGTDELSGPPAPAGTEADPDRTARRDHLVGVLRVAGVLPMGKIDPETRDKVHRAADYLGPAGYRRTHHPKENPDG